MNVAISWLFLAYFGILFTERIQSLVHIATDSSVGFLDGGFNIYVNILTIVSIAATIVMLAACNQSFWVSLFNNSVVPNYSMLTITAGVALVAGMVHTEHTVPVIQFIAYGMLIVAMILRTIQVMPSSPSAFKLWFSLIFLTIFSMAIPVMYPSQIDNKVLFHIIEAVTALVLVAAFTLMLRQMFLGNGTDLLWIIPVVLAAVGDAVILAMRWKEQVNTFVLIFAVLTLVTFAIGKVIFHFIK